MCLSKNKSVTSLSLFLMQGCHDALEALLKKNIQWVIVAALVIAFLQVCIISKQRHVELTKNDSVGPATSLTS